MNDDSSSGENQATTEESNGNQLGPGEPSHVEMEKRFAFRKSIEEQTARHRRTYVNNSSNQTPNNIVFSLWDRERHSSKKVVMNSRRRLLRNRKTVIESHNSNDNNQIQAKSKKNYPLTIYQEIREYTEHCSVTKYESSYLHHLGETNGNTINEDGQDQRRNNNTASSPAVSTISIAFSPDAKTMASTHGDHTVKITCCNTGQLLKTLEGHPRTPWTVKYHPTNPNILASGCLGFQVRVWCWTIGLTDHATISNNSSNGVSGSNERGNTNCCLHMIRLHHAIISLSFHPVGGHILAIASGSKLHFWDYGNYGGYTRGSSNNSNNNNDEDRQGGQQQRQRSTRGVLTEVEQRHMLRCVHFTPSGDTIIVGGINPQPADEHSRDPRVRGGMSGGGMSFYLRLWDFNVVAALRPYSDRLSNQQRGRLLTNPRTFVPRALLYNDGGFDVSPDGKVLCACAEYWLPEGVSSAMELLQKEKEKLEKEEEESDKFENDQSLMRYNDRTVPDTGEQITDRERNKGNEQTSGAQQHQEEQNSFSSPPRAGQSRRMTPVSNNASMQLDMVPVTPPNPNRLQLPLSPPSPPGRRWAGGLGQRRGRVENHQESGSLGLSGENTNQFQRTNSGGNTRRGNATTITSIPPPPPPPPSYHQLPIRPPHPLSVVSVIANYADESARPGRYVPHVVTVSLETSPIITPTTSMADGGIAVAVGGRRQFGSVALKGCRPRLGQLLEACPLDGAKASGVTCVKFSPSADYCLLGYGVRDPESSVDGINGDDRYHPVTALYKVKGGMTHVSTMLSGDDDVNIARFHPKSGYGFVYGTKQGRVRNLSPRPWNYYDC